MTKLTACIALGTITLALASAAGATGERSEAGEAGSVGRAVLTSGVADREPVDEIQSLYNDQAVVYFFTELHDLQKTNVTHRWTHDGKSMGDVAFHVGGPRWRVWSTKNLEPSWTGQWKVDVVDAEGNVLASREFTLLDVRAKSAPAPTEPVETVPAKPTPES